MNQDFEGLFIKSRTKKLKPKEASRLKTINATSDPKRDSQLSFNRLAHHSIDGSVKHQLVIKSPYHKKASIISESSDLHSLRLSSAVNCNRVEYAEKAISGSLDSKDPLPLITHISSEITI
jgi:hypothetical protein